MDTCFERDDAPQPGTARRRVFNPVAIVGIDIVLTVLLAVWLSSTSLPLITALPFAWIGGAVASVAFLMLLTAIDGRQL